MNLSIFHMGHFIDGQFDMTEVCKSKSETGKIFSINDGDVTTNIYEKSEHLRLDDLRSFVVEAYGEGNGSYVATYSEDEEGNISVYFNGSVDNIVDDMESICFHDEDGDEEYWEVFTGNNDELLVTSAFMSVEEVLENHPHLSISKKGKA
jgi:hypothetical protein